VNVRLIRPWRHYNTGFVLKGVNPGQAEEMIRRGFAEEVPEQQPVAAPAAVEDRDRRHSYKGRK
jgi:hypothetical protein